MLVNDSTSPNSCTHIEYMTTIIFSSSANVPLNCFCCYLRSIDWLIRALPRFNSVSIPILSINAVRTTKDSYNVWVWVSECVCDYEDGWHHHRHPNVIIIDRRVGWGGWIHLSYTATQTHTHVQRHSANWSSWPSTSEERMARERERVREWRGMRNWARSLCIYFPAVPASRSQQ